MLDPLYLQQGEHSCTILYLMKMKMKIVTGKTQGVTLSNDVTWSFY